MKNLWAPWRMAYILDPEAKGQACIFDQAMDKSCDKQHLILLRDRLTVVLLNRFPYTNGHLLLAPARHVADITALDPEENSALMARMQDCVRILRRRLKPDGFNIGLNQGRAAGAGLEEHLHFHLVPRWQEDHNFITVVAEIRTIPEHFDCTFARLLPDFQALLGNHETEM